MNTLEKRGISQEGLKLFACLSMLLDHIGATLVPWIWLRGVGRLAFPIYCYLLVQGAEHTHDPKGYMIRLAIGMVLSELPFDYAFWGGLTWAHQSVMVTLLLGLMAIEIAKRIKKPALGFLIFLPFGALAEAFQTDYGGWGIALIAAFWLTGENRRLLQVFLVGCICYLMPSFRISLGTLRIPIELLGVLSMILICLASGKKRWNSKWIQWAFYLFYPVHLAILAILERI